MNDILDAALALVGEKGIATLTMREIAKASGMPLASVYQYFPNKSAVIETLHKRFTEDLHSNLDIVLPDVESVEDILPLALALMENYHQRLAANPALQDLLNAIQADKTLHDMDIEGTRSQADKFIGATETFIEDELKEAYGRAVHLIFILAGSTIRLAMMAEPEEGAKFIEDFRNLVRAQFAPFSRGRRKKAARVKTETL